jgi:Protein of unknown function (DUF3563)
MRNDSFPLHNPGGLGIFDVMAKALTPPPFQPDFHRRWDRHDPVVTATPAKASAPVSKQVPEPRRGLMERLELWFWARRQRDLEAYLARSADIHDLEARIRDLERDPSHPYY